MSDTPDLARMRPSPPMTHEQALDAICGCAATVTVLSYEEAVGAYFKLRDLGDPAAQRPLLDRIAELEGERTADAIYRREETAARLAAEAQVSALTRENEGLREAASRWQALMRCGRIKMQGSSGVDPNTGERTGSNVHFGAEFWPEPVPQDYRASHPTEADNYDRSTRWGVAALTALADAVMEREAALSPTADEPAKGEA